MGLKKSDPDYSSNRRFTALYVHTRRFAIDQVDAIVRESLSA